MRSVAFIEERVLFSPDIPSEVNNLLQAAVAASPVDQSRAETLFLQAQALDSHCLQTYFALYKFYFFQKRLLMQNGLSWRAWRNRQNKAVSPTIIVNWLETFSNGTCMPMSAACFICIP